MTIDEAIKHCEEVAEEKEREAQDLEYSKLDWKHEANQCSECASEHRQLAEWLKELKKYRAIFEKVGRILHENGYTIDDLDTIFGKANDEEVNADGDSD